MNQYIDLLSKSFYMLEIPCSPSDVALMTMQIRCRYFEHLFSRLQILIKRGSIQQEIMFISNNLKDLKIDCKRTWLVDVRPTKNLYIVFLKLCEKIMHNYLTRNSHKLTTTPTIFSEEFFSEYESQVEPMISSLAACQLKVDNLILNITKLKELHTSNEKGISLDEIQNAIQKLKTTRELPYFLCKNPNGSQMHPQYHIEFPQITKHYDCLSKVKTENGYDICSMITLLDEVILNEQLKLPDINLDVNGIVDLKSRLNTLELNTNKDCLNSFECPSINYFEAIEI
eukprot:NODE_832_length_3620_cov_0.696677.p2 type:complete len:285 gc:universal NODE_832_length_3620_cov_0.696677:1510-2364(+)